jgi:DNA-binding NarL/FixJ family response regulator
LFSSSRPTSGEDYSQRTVLLADSHQETLGVVRTLLDDRFDVVVMVADMESLIQVARKLSPDAVIADLTLPRNGRGANVNIMKHVLAECPELKIIVLSVHDDSVVIREVMATGAAGYVLKSRAATDLVPVIEHVLVGNS